MQPTVEMGGRTCVVVSAIKVCERASHQRLRLQSGWWHESKGGIAFSGNDLRNGVGRSELSEAVTRMAGRQDLGAPPSRDRNRLKLIDPRKS
jgi:hypothetical protein